MRCYEILPDGAIGMIFDRRHYWQIALALQEVQNNETKYDMILKLCDMFVKDNPKFQSDLFIEVAESEVI